MIKNRLRVGTFVSDDRQVTRQVAVLLQPLGVGYAFSTFDVEIDGVWHWSL